MSVHARILDPAKEDLASIYSFLVAHESTRADRFIDNFYATCKRIVTMPRLGRVYPLRHKAARNMRCLAVAGFADYLIFYTQLKEGIEVWRVLHGAQDIPAVFESEE